MIHSSRPFWWALSSGFVIHENTVEDGYTGLAPAGCFASNGYGLHDMVGNVWKWTTSLYSTAEKAGTPASRIQRVVKGGSSHLGFRTVRTRPPNFVRKLLSIQQQKK